MPVRSVLLLMAIFSLALTSPLRTQDRPSLLDRLFSGSPEEAASSDDEPAAGRSETAAPAKEQRVGTVPLSPEVPKDRFEIQLTFAPLVERVAPAVVNIYANRQIRTRSPFAGDPFFEQFFQQQSPSGPQAESSLGSGVIVDASGVVITNTHVIEGAETVRVAMADGREFSSRIILKDDRSDLAILKIVEEGEFATVEFGNSDALKVGDLVLAIGNPFGVGQTVTSGIVSALARNRVGISDFGFFIQTDAAINPGNSGGALIDMGGRLIGVNTAIFSQSGGSNGIGFAIPSNMVHGVVQAALEGHRYRRPYVGATFAPVSADMAKRSGLASARGALVVALIENGPAQKAGLKVGDIIQSFNDAAIQHPDALGYRLETAGIGTVARLGLLRGGKALAISLAMEAAPETVPRNEVMIGGQSPFSGVRIANLSPAVAEELGTPSDKSGVVVLDTQNQSPAARFGLRAGDIFLDINGEAITDTRQMQDITNTPAKLWRFEIERDGRPVRQVVR